MPEVLIRTAEPKTERGEYPEAKRPTRLVHSLFKYYIHDSVSTLRLQLIGDLQAADVSELSGSWETAKTTLGHRRLVLDLGQLHSVDQEGGRWLAQMVDAGAASIPLTHFEEGKKHSLPKQASAIKKLNLMARVLGVVRGAGTTRTKTRGR